MNSAVGEASGYRLDDRGIGDCQELSLIHVFRVGSENQLASLPMCEGDFLGVKRPGNDARRPLTPNLCRRQETWISTSTATHAFVARCLIRGMGIAASQQLPKFVVLN
jgi:hypothetical protein